MAKNDSPAKTTAPRAQLGEQGPDPTSKAWHDAKPTDVDVVALDPRTEDNTVRVASHSPGTAVYHPDDEKAREDYEKSLEDVDTDTHASDRSTRAVDTRSPEVNYATRDNIIVDRASNPTPEHVAQVAADVLGTSVETLAPSGAVPEDPSTPTVYTESVAPAEASDKQDPASETNEVVEPNEDE